MKVKIAPSLECIDFLNIQKEIEILDQKADYYHVDMMDWHYSKSLGLSPSFIESVRSISDVPIEAHMYIDNIDLDLIDACIDAGSDIITMPPEVVLASTMRFIRHIKSRGKDVGFFIAPGHRVDIIEPYINYIDYLVINMVDPGFPGQKLVPESIDKISEARALRDKYQRNFQITVDGNCSKPYYKKFYNAGADIFVLGSSGLFNLSEDTQKALDMAERHIIETLAD